MFYFPGLILLIAVSCFTANEAYGQSTVASETLIPTPPNLFWVISAQNENLALNGFTRNLVGTPYDEEDSNRYFQHWLLYNTTAGTSTIVNSITAQCVQPVKCESVSNVITAPCDRNILQDWNFYSDGTIRPVCNSTYVLQIQFINNYNVALGLESDNDIIQNFELQQAIAFFCK